MQRALSTLRFKRTKSRPLVETPSGNSPKRSATFPDNFEPIIRSYPIELGDVIRKTSRLMAEAEPTIIPPLQKDVEKQFEAAVSSLSQVTPKDNPMSPILDVLELRQSDLEPDVEKVRQTLIAFMNSTFRVRLGRIAPKYPAELLEDFVARWYDATFPFVKPVSVWGF